MHYDAIYVFPYLQDSLFFDQNILRSSLQQEALTTRGLDLDSTVSISYVNGELHKQSNQSRISCNRIYLARNNGFYKNRFSPEKILEFMEGLEDNTLVLIEKSSKQDDEYFNTLSSVLTPKHTIDLLSQKILKASYNNFW